MLSACGAGATEADKQEARCVERMRGEIAQQLGNPEELSIGEPIPVNGRHRVGFTYAHPVTVDTVEGYATYPRSCLGVAFVHPTGDPNDRFPYTLE